MAGVRLGDDLETKLAMFAGVFQRPKSSLIREALLDKIEEWEDMRMIMESYRDKGKRWTAEEIMQRYDIKP